MSRTRLVLLSSMAMLSVSAMLSSSAKAAINFEWKVGGAKLEASETKGFTVNSDGKILGLRGTVAGLGALLLTNEISVEPGAKLTGGAPGTGEGTIVFKSVTSDSPPNCGVLQGGGPPGTIKGTPVKSEIVEGASGGVGTGEVDILFTPKTGETLDTFELTGASCALKGTVIPITGLFLGLPSPQKTEVLRQDLVFEAVTKEYRNFKNEFKKAGLTFAGSAATISGLGLVLLESDQAYGPF